jgi:uncharacterized membrane protein YdjX (TVP38/TMEM64 family)
VSPRLRLALLIAFLAACLLVFGVWRPIGADELRDAVEATGPLAPIAFVALAAALALLMVPGALLAAGAGLLFGPLLGTGVALASAVTAAACGLLLGRRIGRDGLVDAGGRRVERVTELLERHGTLAVIGQRLAPGVPDGPSNYAFGAAGLRVRQVVAGTLIGSAPRAFAYAAFGSSVGTLDPALAAAGAAALLLAALAGLLIAGRAARPYVRRARTRRRAGSGPPGE